MTRRQPSRTSPSTTRRRPAKPQAAPAAGSQKTGTGTGTPPATGIVTLFNVRIRHTYYNLADDRCPDFAIVPTPTCRDLLRRLGILFQGQGDGFRISAPASRLQAITNQIVHTFCPDTPGYGYWLRLTFGLVLRNPAFVGITALPLTTCPTRQNLYASNLRTTSRDGELLFGQGAGLGAEALYPVTGATLSVPTTADATVTVCDISGRVVRTTDVTAGMTAGGATGGAAAISLAGLPHDLYTVSSSPASAYTGPPAVLYAPPPPLTSGLVDLLLTQPTAGTGDPAAFPIGPLPEPPPTGTVLPVPAVRTVSLTLSFQARRTTWNYYVVSQGGRGRLAPDLSISGKEATFEQAPDPVALPNGEQAILFSSTTTLPLRQRSPFRFSLSGQRHGPGGSRDSVSVPWLPGAPASPVWPASTGDPVSGSSEIYVYV